MRSNSSSRQSLLFFYLFVVYQVLNFTQPESLVFFFINLILTIVLSVNIQFTKNTESLVTAYCAVCVIGALAQFLNGVTFYGMWPKLLLVFMPYVGYVYIKNNKSNLNWFNYIIIYEYILFYIAFFSDVEYGLANESDTFGHSSANTISITLNMTLCLYYILNKYYKDNKQKYLIIFGVINIILIVQQQSRAGLFVSVLLLFLILLDSMRQQRKGYIRLLAIIVLVILAFSTAKNVINIQDYFVKIGVDKAKGDYSSEVRAISQVSFFQQLNLRNAILGFPNNSDFASLNRTFNAYLDLWKDFGILPLVTFIILFFRRLINHRKYSLPLYCFLPIFAYTFFESFIFHSAWDFIVYCFLFLGYDPNMNNSKGINNRIIYNK